MLPLSKCERGTRYADGMRFSSRTAWQPGVNDWAEAVDKTRNGTRPLVDLTVSNPTACGLGPSPEEVLKPLSLAGALRYLPDPLGMVQAREAVVAYYRDHGSSIATARICLTTSTSEAYSFLFRLLCDPGDEVLIARPSYPLFELLTGLDDVVLREYPLFYEPGSHLEQRGAWSIDLLALEASVTDRTRAVILVHPNNPTGHYVSRREREALTLLCAQRGLALIVDEVFLDYSISGMAAEAATFTTVDGCLCFVLSGLSKICALPQMKASWIVACGPQDDADEAMRRLEIIGDTFLSMNAPVQFALRSWLEARAKTQAAIRERLRRNLQVLDRRLQGSLGHRFTLEGGWTVVLRVPRFVDGQTFAYAALERGVLVQPGPLYGLPEGRCVVSLLSEPEEWVRGLALLPL